MHEDLAGRVLRVDALHTPGRGEVEALPDALIAVDPGGVITDIRAAGSPGYDTALRAAGERLFTAPPGAVLLPGLVDLHVHAPQYPQLGTALDLPLEEWLLRYTFPLEARYGDLSFARAVYDRLVRALLAEGTTTAVYFATIHDAATCLLADLCLRHGQRAFVGRVAMDHPETCPDAYRDCSAEAALSGTRRVIEHVRAAPGNAAGRVRPMVTPRFIPSCTDALLAGLGELAREADVPVTTHVSESDWEHGFVRDRHGMSDAESLDRFGLLRPGSVLAHGCFLSDGDMGLMRDRGTGVAHCPWSNAYFANAVFPLRRALDIGLPVGLGSDISGGPVGSVWETARMALVAARLRASGTDPDLATEARSHHPGDRVDAVTAFWLATAGGADALGLDVGRFRPGQRLDAILVVPGDDTSAIAPWPGEDEAPARRLERLVHGTSRADIADVFVDGRRVSGARG